MFSDKIKSEVKEIKKDVKEEINYLNLLLPTSSITEDANHDSQGNIKQFCEKKPYYLAIYLAIYLFNYSTISV